MRREWQYEEILFVKNNYRKMTRKTIANALHRSLASVTYQCEKLKLFKPNKKLDL